MIEDKDLTFLPNPNSYKGDFWDMCVRIMHKGLSINTKRNELNDYEIKAIQQLSVKEPIIKCVKDEVDGGLTYYIESKDRKIHKGKLNAISKRSR